jgi:hypothetical protein
MKTFFTIIGILLLLLVGFVAYVFLTLDPEELGQRVLGLINANTGVEVTAERFEVRPLKGIELEGGRLQGELESGTVSGSLDRMALDYELLPILKGEVVVHQILVEKPDLSVVSKPAPETKEPAAEPAEGEEAPAEPAPEPSLEEPSSDEGSRGVSKVSISEIRVTDGKLSVTSEGSEEAGLSVDGFDLELGDLALDSTAPSPLLGFAASGGLEIDRIQLNDMTLEGGRGEMNLDRGRMSVTDLGVETANASLQVAELAADLTQDPAPYRLQVGGSYDVNSLVEADGDGFGPAALEFSANGAGPDVNDMAASGTFRLEDGQIPAFPMMVRIEKLLGKSLIVGYPYEGTDIVFSIDDGVAEIEPFVMGFENLQMAGGGAIELAGPIDMQIDIRVPRESVSNKLLDPFIDGMTDEEGWTTIPFNIGGSMAEPDVDFDMTSIKQTATDMGKRAVTRALDSAVGSLKERTLGRRKKDDG